MNYIIEYGIDAVLLIIFSVNVIKSYRRGFLMCLLSLVSVVVAVFAAFNYSQPAAEWTYDNLLSDRIVSELDQAINEGLSSSTAADTVNSVIENIPEVLKNQLQNFDVDINSLSEQISDLELSAHDTAEKISEQIIRPGALILLKLLCYILIFLLIRFVSGCILGLILKISMPKLFKAADKWLGGVIGILKGGILVIMLTMLISAFAGFSEPESQFSSAYENSRICGALEEFGIADLTELNFEFENILK